MQTNNTKTDKLDITDVSKADLLEALVDLSNKRNGTAYTVGDMDPAEGDSLALEVRDSGVLKHTFADDTRLDLVRIDNE